MTAVHVMIDIETMGTRPGAMIASIGACTFGDGRARERFSHVIELRGQDTLGLHIDPETVGWWLAQSAEARAALGPSHFRVDLPTALLGLNDFLEEARTDAAAGLTRPQLRLWANGANFDPVLLEAAFRACSLPPAWSFRGVRCHRTLLDIAGVDGKAFRPNVAHDALADAMAQADAAEEAMRRLGLIERPPA